MADRPLRPRVVARAGDDPGGRIPAVPGREVADLVERPGAVTSPDHVL
ncbi:hypothetical protein [Streptomyces sp. NPDC018045]